MIQSTIARNYNKDSLAYSNMTTPLFTEIQELKREWKYMKMSFQNKNSNIRSICAN